MGASETYLLKLKAELGPEVDKGTSSLAKLEAQIAREVAALTTLESKLGLAKVKLSELQAGAALGAGKKGAGIGGVLAQHASIKGIEGKIAAKKVDISGLKGAAPEIRQLADENTKTALSFRKLGAAAGETDGQLGSFLRAIGKMKAAGAAGAILALVGVVLILATALIGGAIAFARFAFGAADAARASRLMTTAAAGSTEAGVELDAVISDVANHSPLARDKIAEMGRAMELAHLKGRNMQVTLEAATTATSAIGDAAGAAFTSIAEKSQLARRFMLSKNDFTGLSAELEGTGVAFSEVADSVAKAMGVSVAQAGLLIRRGQVSVKVGLEAMNDAVQKKFGGTVKAQMLSFTTQMDKLKANLAGLFSNVLLDKFLTAFKKITDMFSDTTYQGYMLKKVFTGMFTGLFDSLAAAGPAIGDFIDGVIIGSLMLYLGFLKVRNAMRDTFGADIVGNIDFVKVGMYGIIAAATVLFGSLALLAGIGYALYLAIVKPIMKIYDAFMGLGKIDLEPIGKNIVEGLLRGLFPGPALVLDAMKAIGSAISSALPNKLDMHSPSVLLTNQSKMMVRSIVEPIEEGAPDAGKAMAELGGGRPDFSGAAAAAGAVAARGATGNSGGNVTIGDITYAGERKDFPDFEERVLAMVERARWQGASPVPT